MIIVACNDRPGYGGAATNAYNLIKALKKKYVVHGIFFNSNPLYPIDPNGVGNIHHCYEYIFQTGNDQVIDKYVRTLRLMPKIILCKSPLTVSYTKRLWPFAKIVYLCPGPSGMLQVENQQYSIVIEESESTAIELADLIVFNSEFTQMIFHRAFPNHMDKAYRNIIDTSTHHARYPVFETSVTYDIMIAASILTRPEKNNLFLIDILNQEIFDQYAKVIIGNDNEDFLDIPNSTVYDLVPQAQLLFLLSQTRILVFPSIYDSNPSTVLEALHYGCKVLVSSNLDISKELPAEYVCKSFDASEWQVKLIHLLETDIPFTYKPKPFLNIESLIDNI